jgi:VanZ family protein
MATRRRPRYRWLTVGFWMGATAAGSLLPSAPAPGDIIPITHADLLVHFLLYAVLALLVAWAGKACTKRKLAAVAAGAFAVGLALECIQPLTGRQFDLCDLGANAAGALLGAAIALAACRLRHRHRA